MVDAMPTDMPEITRPVINIPRSYMAIEELRISIRKGRQGAYDSGALQNRADDPDKTGKDDGFLATNLIPHVTDK
jgi:hypothetical protein